MSQRYPPALRPFPNGAGVAFMFRIVDAPPRDERRPGPLDNRRGLTNAIDRDAIPRASFDARASEVGKVRSGQVGAMANSAGGKRIEQPGSRLALVADAGPLADAVQEHVKTVLGQPAFRCSFDAIRDHLGRDTDGLLLLLAAAEADADAVFRLVQDVTLRQLPPAVVLVAGDPGPDLSALAPYVARRLRWPADAPLLTPLLKDRCGRGRDF